MNNIYSITLCIISNITLGKLKYSIILATDIESLDDQLLICKIGLLLLNNFGVGWLAYFIEVFFSLHGDLVTLSGGNSR